MRFKGATANLPTIAEFVQQWTPQLSVDEAKKVYHDLLNEEIYLSECGTYQVNLDRDPVHGFNGMTVYHLSIKRVDREPFHDWRILQEIKSGLLGDEVEAIELYPAESRVVDTANQYHLFAFPNGETVPVGFPAGMKTDDPGHGAKQRPRA